jgi:hypothetical protein
MQFPNNEYAWEDIKIILPGTALPSDGVVGIKYDSNKEHVNIYGAGDSPVSMGRGKREFTASVTVLQSVIEGMQSSLPRGKSLLDLTPFNITVSYAPAGGTAITDQLIGCRIAKLPKEMKSGDTHMEVELEIIPFNIKYNV